MDHEAVRDLSGRFGHAGTDATQEDARQAVRIRAGVEERCHQRVRVELTAELQWRALVPRRPNGADREDHLAHALGRPRPRHGEAFLDVRLDLRAEPEVEPSVRRELEVVGELRERHRRARERDRDRGRQLDALSVLGREEQRKERIVLTLEAVDAVVPGVFDGACSRGHGRQIGAGQRDVYQHEVPY